jgi:competence protein ComEC
MIAAGLAAGMALGGADSLTVFALAALGVILLTAVGLRADVALAACALLIAGSGVGAARLAAIDADPLARAPAGELTLRGHLVDLPRSDRYGSRLRIRMRGWNQLVQVRSREPVPAGLTIGDEIVVVGRPRRIDPASAKSPVARSYAQYLLRTGVRRQLTTARVSVTGNRRGGAQGAVDSIRRRAERALAFGLAPEPAALLRGMVLGGDAALPERTVDQFRAAGLSHILAVSGQNVLLIVILVVGILTACGAPRGVRLAVPAMVIVLYALLCGAQASVVRAAAMGLAALVALAASRPASRIYALILAAIVVLAFNPRACADVGAQLSFAAVLGIMAFTSPLARVLARWPRWTAEALAATVGATLATAPLMAYHFKAVSLVSLIANVLGQPLIGPIVWLGSLAAAIGQFSLPLAALLGAPCQFLLGSLISLAGAAAALPGAQATTPDFGLFGLIGSLAVVVLAAMLANGWVAPPRQLRGLRRTPVLALSAVAVLFVAGWWLVSGGGPRKLSAPAIVMLDVGQGDATLLVGSEDCAALIDGGPPGASLGSRLRALGVRRLGALLITHPEADHFEGALELVRDGRVPVTTLLDGGGNTPSADYAELRRRLRAAGTRIVPALAGAAWSCPGLSIELLAPSRELLDAPPTASANARAAVTSVQVGKIRLFASGDAESSDLAGLPLSPVDVLKVPHHGSADPGLGGLLARLRPSVALIGVGADNRYGHPTPQTLGALASAGALVLRTDRGGDIVLREVGAGGLAIGRRRR